MSCHYFSFASSKQQNSLSPWRLVTYKVFMSWRDKERTKMAMELPAFVAKACVYSKYTLDPGLNRGGLHILGESGSLPGRRVLVSPSVEMY